MSSAALTYGDLLGTAAEALRATGHTVLAIEDAGRYTCGPTPAWTIARLGDEAPDEVADILSFDHPDRVIVDLPRGFDSPRWSGRRHQILAELARAGYVVEGWLLNSANHGAGYAKKRYFMVGVHCDLSTAPRRPRRVYPQVTAVDALGLEREFLPAWTWRRPGPALPWDDRLPWGPPGEDGIALSRSLRLALLGLPRGHYAGAYLVEKSAEATPVALYRSILDANKEA